MELKHILARQPGPEAAEQLQIYRHTLREKTKQLKVSGTLCLFLATREGPGQVRCLDARSQSPKCHTPQRLAFLEFQSQKEQDASQTCPAAARLIDPLTLCFLKGGGERVRKELERG